MPGNTDQLSHDASRGVWSSSFERIRAGDWYPVLVTFSLWLLDGLLLDVMPNDVRPMNHGIVHRSKKCPSAGKLLSGYERNHRRRNNTTPQNPRTRTVAAFPALRGWRCCDVVRSRRQLVGIPRCEEVNLGTSHRKFQLNSLAAGNSLRLADLSTLSRRNSAPSRVRTHRQ